MQNFLLKSLILALILGLFHLTMLQKPWSNFSDRFCPRVNMSYLIALLYFLELRWPNFRRICPLTSKTAVICSFQSIDFCNNLCRSLLEYSISCVQKVQNKVALIILSLIVFLTQLQLSNLSIYFQYFILIISRYVALCIVLFLQLFYLSILLLINKIQILSFRLNLALIYCLILIKI